jgi:hypothetical protein
MAEEQALDRCHRLGQIREVNAFRYIIKNSIEEVSIPIPQMHPNSSLIDLVRGANSEVEVESYTGFVWE